MAEKRKNSGLSKVDSFTSNGYGVESTRKLTPQQKEKARKINAEVAAAKTAKGKKK